MNPNVNHDSECVDIHIDGLHRLHVWFFVPFSCVDILQLLSLLRADGDNSRDRPKEIAQYTARVNQIV